MIEEPAADTIVFQPNRQPQGIVGQIGAAHQFDAPARRTQHLEWPAGVIAQRQAVTEPGLPAALPGIYQPAVGVHHPARTSGDDPGLFISWDEAANGDITGRIVVDASTIDADNRDPEDPINMRIDFTYTDTAKLADMFLRFDTGNAWADGLRIEVSKDLTASPLGQVFTARGLMEMKAQFAPVDGISELPQLRMYTVSDRLGEGAAVAEFVDVSLPLEIDASTGDHLGNYIFDKTDIYFFDADQRTAEPWDWIDKTITDSQYRGGRNLTTITEADIIDFLGLSLTYFSGTECANVGDDCTAMLNAIFADGFAGQEQNQGSDPMDWRSAAITSPAYLGSVYPNGSDWAGAFDPAFTP